MYSLSKEERKELGMIGHNHVKENYGFDKFKQKWVDIGSKKKGGGFKKCGRSKQKADAKRKYPKCLLSWSLVAQEVILTILMLQTLARK